MNIITIHNLSVFQHILMLLDIVTKFLREKTLIWEMDKLSNLTLELPFFVLRTVWQFTLKNTAVF